MTTIASAMVGTKKVIHNKRVDRTALELDDKLIKILPYQTFDGGILACRGGDG